MNEQGPQPNDYVPLVAGPEPVQLMPGGSWGSAYNELQQHLFYDEYNRIVQSRPQHAGRYAAELSGMWNGEVVTNPSEALRKRSAAAYESYEHHMHVVRQSVGHRTDKQKGALEKYILDEAPDVLVKDIMRYAAKDGMDAHPLEWLVGDGETADATLYEVLKWHVEYLDGLQQNPRIKQTIEEVKAGTKQGIVTAVAQNKLSEVVLERTDLIDDTRVYFADPFSRDFADDTVSAVAHPRSTYVAIRTYAGLTGRAKSEALESLPHELAHQVISARRDGSMSGSRGKMFPWIREEVGARLTAGDLTDSINQVTKIPTMPDGSYEHITAAYWALGNGPYGKVEQQQFTVGWSGTDEERAELASAYDSAWHRDGVLQDFEKKGLGRAKYIRSGSPNILQYNLQADIGRRLLGLLNEWRP